MILSYVFVSVSGVTTPLIFYKSWSPPSVSKSAKRLFVFVTHESSVQYKLLSVSYRKLKLSVTLNATLTIKFSKPELQRLLTEKKTYYSENSLWESP